MFVAANVSCACSDGCNADGPVRDFVQFRLADQLFAVGDAALLRNPDADGLPFVARIVRLFEASKGAKYADVQWFYRPHDTVLPANKHDPCELFDSNTTDTNTLDAIDAPCSVLEWARRADDVAADFPQPHLRDVFYRRRRYDPARQRIVEHADHDSDYEADTAEESASDGEVDDEAPRRRAQSAAKRKAGKAALPANRSRKQRGRLELHVPLAAQARGAVTGDAHVARAQLHVGSVPDSLPCREARASIHCGLTTDVVQAEFLEICAFVEERIRDGASGCMFVSGVPGTGKTATIRAVARHLLHDRDQGLPQSPSRATITAAAGTLPKFQFVEINGMALTSPQQSYADLWQAVAERNVRC